MDRSDKNLSIFFMVLLTTIKMEKANNMGLYAMSILLTNRLCKKFANYEQNIKSALQLKIEELQKEWESLGQNKVIESKDNYIQRLFDVIESFFVFKDNSKISIIGEEDSAFDFFEDGFQYCVYRNLIDISLFRMFDTFDHRMHDNINDIEQLKIYNTLQDTVYQEVPYINKSYQVFRGNLLKKHPSKIIDWFRKYFDLKYSGYSNKYDHEQSMINNYLSNINIDIKTSYKNQLLEPKEIESYFVDIDYALSEHNIKMRLSYHFQTQDVMESMYLELFFANNQSNVKDYILKELNDDKSSLYRQLCSEFGYNNHFGIYLIGVQFAKIDEEFELQISKYDKNVDGKFYQYYQQSCINESLLHPAKAFETSVNELTKNILKKQSYSKYICIEEGIKNNDEIDDSYNVICNDNDFNVYKDLTFSTYKYVFEALNNELVHIMNKTSKEVLADIIKNIYEKRTLIVNQLRATVKNINDMKIKSEDVASKELLNQLKEYSNFLFVENDKIIDTSGNELKIVHLNDKYGFKLMSLYYFYETFNFLEVE